MNCVFLSGHGNCEGHGHDDVSLELPPAIKTSAPFPAFATAAAAFDSLLLASTTAPLETRPSAGNGLKFAYGQNPRSNALKIGNGAIELM